MPNYDEMPRNRDTVDNVSVGGRSAASCSNTMYSMLDVFRNNYDIVKALAELDKSDSTSNLSSIANTSSDGEQSPLVYDSIEVIPEERATVRRRRNSDPSMWASRHKQICMGIAPQPPTSPTNKWSLLGENLSGAYKNLVDAFTETNDDIPSIITGPKKLSANALRRNIRRCLSSSKPYLESCAAFQDLLIWESPLTSLMAFFIYGHMFYHGYLWTVFLGLILLQLFFNYLSTQRGINIGLYFMPRREITMPRLEHSGINLIFDVARRAQLLLEFFADLMEKLYNLFMWKRPDTSLKFCYFIGFFFSMSLVCSTSTCFFFIGLTAGLKTFITAFLYYRFPKLRNKLDFFSYFFLRTPISDEKSVRRVKNASVKKSEAVHIAANSPHLLKNAALMSSVVDIALLNTRKRSISMTSAPQTLADYVNQGTASMSSDVGSCKSLSISQLQCTAKPLNFSKSVEADAPRVQCIMERSCMIVDKNKTFAKRVSSGTLLLTHTEVMFRYNRHRAEGRAIMYMPIDELLKVTKINSLTPIPGRAIEIQLESTKRPVQFVALSKRDEFFDAVIDVAAEAGIKL